MRVTFGPDQVFQCFVHKLLANRIITAWKVSKYGFFSGPYFPAFGLNPERYEVPLRILSGKSGPEKTP